MFYRDRRHFNVRGLADTMKYLQVLLVGAVLAIQVYSQNYRQSVYHNNHQSTSQYSHQLPRGAGSCPEKNGRYPTDMCDGYVECNEGVPEEKVCQDGLLFNAAAGVFAFPCQYPIDVDCSGREQTHPAQPTDECPHQFGYYRMGDQADCGKFKNCVDGRAYIFDCPEGLAFNGETYRCDWPDQVSSCNAEAYLGFTCPQDAKTLGLGLGQEEYRYFRSPNDCQRYFICVEGKPRLYNCGEGRAFNDLINACDGAENVTGCAVPSHNFDTRVDDRRGQTYSNYYRG
ncbi:protein obstructor-E-like [Diabrotica virgifera virgifera]|uniref:Protein obstructor-E-like n=1 Tax=Diabrotica virgifera virgifera TaxID=50390 RepID=A0A6P7FAG1_DIAVI|nr:protein obstructor-E-like [Diabrotica virgifera virgifera]